MTTIRLQLATIIPHGGSLLVASSMEAPARSGVVWDSAHRAAICSSGLRSLVPRLRASFRIQLLVLSWQLFACRLATVFRMGARSMRLRLGWLGSFRISCDRRVGEIVFVADSGSSVASASGACGSSSLGLFT